MFGAICSQRRTSFQDTHKSLLLKFRNSIFLLVSSKEVYEIYLIEYEIRSMRILKHQQSGTSLALGRV